MSTIDFPHPFQLDRSRHASAQVFDQLRNMIISLALKPGTVLPRVELADYFALSLTPIRDALMRLSEEGLVDIYPQHATVVRQIDVASAQQAHFLRLSIELEVVQTLSTCDSSALIGPLRDAIAQGHSAFEAEDYNRFAQTDQAFHRLLYQAAKVDSLWELMRRNSGNLDRLRRLHLPIPGKALMVLHDHEAIVAAIAEGNAMLAQDCVRSHLSGTLAHLDAIRARYPHYLLEAAAE